MMLNFFPYARFSSFDSILDVLGETYCLCHFTFHTMYVYIYNNIYILYICLCNTRVYRLPSPELFGAQEAADYGETDSDNDVDSNSPGAGASGPGPPDYRAIGGSGGRGRAGGECAKKRARDGSNSSRDMSGCGAGRRGGNGGTAVQHGGDGGRDEGRGETSRQPCSEGLQAFVVPTSLKTRLDKVNRPTVKEVRAFFFSSIRIVLGIRLWIFRSKKNA